MPEGSAPTRQASRYGAGAVMVAAGIFLSRLAGLAREYVFNRYFGLSAAADVFKAGLRIPNLLQNLFGEGVLSASFIPVYSKLLAEGDEKEANRVAGVIGTVLASTVTLLAIVGWYATPWLIFAIAPGFTGEKHEAAVRLVRIFFPGTALLVMSAWCLGILNSHRKFFLSYSAPVVWSGCMVIAMLAYGKGHQGTYWLAEVVAWASVVGAGLQVLVQLPTVLVLAKSAMIRPGLDLSDPNVREVFRNFGPVVLSRGAVQISAYVDQILASWLPSGSVAALFNAQMISTLPVSLFGMSVAASQLPEMSRALGSASEVAAQLRPRIDTALRNIAFLVVPSAMAFLALGDVLAATLFQGGLFHAADSTWLWGILAGSAVGLLATTMARFYQNAFYALHDTRTPLAFALIRVTLTTVLGYLAALQLPALIGIDNRWGVSGLTASAGIAGWVEFYLLRRSMNARIGKTGAPLPFVLTLWGAAILAAAAGFSVKLGLHRAAPQLLPQLTGLFVLGSYGVVYLAATTALRIPEAQAFLKRVRRR